MEPLFQPLVVSTRMSLYAGHALSGRAAHASLDAWCESLILHRLLSQKDIELDTINNHTVLRTPGGADSDDYTNFVTYRRTGVTLLIIVRFENARSLVANWPTDIYFYRQVRAMHLAGRGARDRFVRNVVSLGAKYALYTGPSSRVRVPASRTRNKRSFTAVRRVLGH